ncbi:MAG: rhomboid family intramembrane serine protease [Candidatus Micrarchaeota archaeon]
MAFKQILGITIAAFLLDFATGYSLSSYFALTPATALFQPWTFITSIFLHGNLLHIFFNMFGLLMFGPLLEQKIGEKNFILLYLTCGILGNIGYVITSGLTSTVPVVGASGAIYGILGALALLQPNLVVFVGFIPMPIYIAAIFWFFMEFGNGITGSQPGIANFAYVFGLFGGLVIGKILKNKIISKGHWLYDQN